MTKKKKNQNNKPKKHSPEDLKKIKEIHDVIFGERNPDKINDYLTRYLDEIHPKISPLSLRKVRVPLKRKKEFRRDFNINALYMGTQEKLQPPLEKEPEQAPLTTEPTDEIPKKDVPPREEPMLEKKEPSFTPEPVTSVKASEEKGVFIDSKTPLPPSPSTQKEAKKEAKKEDKKEDKKEAKEVVKKNSPTPPPPKTKKEKAKKEKHVPLPKKEKQQQSPDMETHDLEESFKKRQEKLSDIINKKDDGRLT